MGTNEDMNKMRLSFFCFILMALPFTGVCVKIRKFYVPGRAANEAPLLCTYDLESHQLYDVKWYKDDQQFFRCLPGGETISYEVEGVALQPVKYMPDGTCSPTLMMLTKKSAGEYKCEVNTEGPLFATAGAARQLKILQQVMTTSQGTTKSEDYTSKEYSEIPASSSASGIFSVKYVLIILYALKIVRL